MYIISQRDEIQSSYPVRMTLSSCVNSSEND